MAMMTNNTKVADSLVILCKVIMPILRNPSFTWKLSDELDFLENYIKMMRIRYGNEMEYHLQCDDGIQDEDFPRFIIQPVMENCFVHGSSSAEVRGIFTFGSGRRSVLPLRCRIPAPFWKRRKWQRSTGRSLKERRIMRASVFAIYGSV